jgi:hypothetical protein
MLVSSSQDALTAKDCPVNPFHYSAYLSCCSLLWLHLTIFSATVILLEGISYSTPNLVSHVWLTISLRKVDLSGFPKGEQLSLHQSLNIPSTDALSGSLKTGSLINIVSGSTEDAIDSIGDYVNQLTNHLKSLLLDYYMVSLWGYYKGEQNSKSFSKCSKPSASFSFGLGQILHA